MCCVECQPTELMIPQSNVMGSEIPHLKGDPRDRAACCLTMSSVTVSMPRCSQDFSPLVTTDLDGRRNRMIAFCVFKAFGETLHTRPCEPEPSSGPRRRRPDHRFDPRQTPAAGRPRPTPSPPPQPRAAAAAAAGGSWRRRPGGGAERGGREG